MHGAPRSQGPTTRRARPVDRIRVRGNPFLECDYLTVLKEIEAYGNNSRRELCKNCVRWA